MEIFKLFLVFDRRKRAAEKGFGAVDTCVIYVNEAIRAGLLDMSPYDKFKDVRGKSKDRVVLTDDELSRIRGLELHDPGMERTRDVFVFCCYTGLSYADLNNFTDDTFATTVVLAYDVPIETLSKMLEHRSIQVAQIYAKVLD